MRFCVVRFDLRLTSIGGVWAFVRWPRTQAQAPAVASPSSLGIVCGISSLGSRRCFSRARLSPLASRWAGLGCSSLWLRCCVTCTAPTFPPHHDALAVTHSLKSNQTPPIDRAKRIGAAERREADPPHKSEATAAASVRRAQALELRLQARAGLASCARAPSARVRTWTGWWVGPPFGVAAWRASGVEHACARGKKTPGGFG